ncbi:hypothetical protein SAMN02910275_01582 [Butyrivibrio sp. INlla18]|uniref:hypothetical protein n=1 Tax=Butyrivibrio sp. INlla18 TaxID=1520806 RepID=UPI00088271EE|nr:hypothetical protein [Butyrivibrio sp. INlla18]SDA61103.1 hypothetical protein SAMN02910275_01582 [Butyrivibrio sp. INlla18]
MTLKEMMKDEYEQGKEARDVEKITDMLVRGKSPEEISDFCGYPLDQVKSVQEKLLHKVN